MLNSHKLQEITKGIFSFTLIILMVLLFPFHNIVNSQQSSSSNYRVDETFFGSGGELDASSSNYRAQSSVGSLGVGYTSSTNYDANGGFLTQNHAYLEMSVENVTVDFGTLDALTTSSGVAQGGACNCSFSVRTYASSQYVVQSISDPPTNEHGDILTAKATQAVPSNNQNVEEFGMNVVDNATPNIGVNPVNYPDNTFADGQAATGYEVADQFKYVKNDIIARAAAGVGNPATGRTDYTISYIAKINSVTRAGLYTMKQSLVVVPTY